MTKKEKQVEKVKNKGKSKWILIPLFIVIILLIGGITVYINKDKHFGCNKIFSKKCETISEKNEPTIYEKVSLNSGDVLNIKDFFIDDLDLTEAQVTFVNQNKEIEDKDLEVTENTNEIISIGIFDVTVQLDGKTYTSVLEIQDKTAPILEVKDIEIEEKGEVTKNSFVVSCEDNSKEECLIFILDDKGEEAQIDTSVGTRKYTLVARDKAGLETKKEVNLTVKKKEPVKNTGNNFSTNKTNSNSNNSSSSSNSNKNNNTMSKKVVSSKAETEDTYEAGKYGTRNRTRKTIKVTTYSDGSVERKTIHTSKSVDTSTFKATSKEMEAEARKVTTSSYSAYQEVTKYVNQYREEVDTEPITLNKELSVLATIRAIEMAYSEKFDHQRPDGRSCYTVGTDMGYNMMIMGENIAYGTGGYNGTAAKVATSWRNSPGHYNNMIAKRYTSIGIGRYTLNGTTYWVQLFGE